MLRRLIAILCWPVLWFLFSQEHWWFLLLKPLAAPGQAVLFERVSLVNAALNHMFIVLSAITGVILIGLPVALWTTRQSGKAFLPIVSNTVAVSQTFPPIAILFLATPVFGFGPMAIIIALFIYGLMPCVHGALTGLKQVPIDAKESAKGMGMGDFQLLQKIEFPLALPAILSGIRTSLILLIATATLAPMVGGTSLGTPIIVGLTVNNSAQVLEGAIPVALIAIAADYTLRVVEQWATPWR